MTPKQVTAERIPRCAETGSRCRFVEIRPLNFSHFPYRICDKCGRGQMNIASLWKESGSVR